ncbi:hypothetical protein [Bordetella sp. LUAb4]|uniref:hypothetical protein n=1 Tax=Bordetella sp. LUAb4 TaxID=2843195 RepID=UPI001E5F076C|nr:hypothetical protein [Bordetella sp. LUAb4]
MVKGLNLFRDWFVQYSGQYVLIGGTAASLTMQNAGLAFRATKDLDIVLHIEALTPAFGAAFWRFIEAGQYAIRQANDTGKPVFYRFQKPADASFPSMIELFARAPDGLVLAPGAQLAPIPMGDAVASLSAILLDDAYYEFIHSTRREENGLSWVSEECLIPLKAVAWLDLSERKAQGASVDGKDIRKHLNDVLRLSQLLSPETRVSLHPKISSDLRRFLGHVRSNAAISPKDLQLGDVSVAELASRIARAFDLEFQDRVLD